MNDKTKALVENLERHAKVVGMPCLHGRAAAELTRLDALLTARTELLRQCEAVLTEGSDLHADVLAALNEDTNHVER